MIIPSDDNTECRNEKIGIFENLEDSSSESISIMNVPIWIMKISVTVNAGGQKNINKR